MSREANKLASIGILAFSIIIGMAGSAFGQISQGAVTGSVRDPSGNVVPGASVVLTNEANGFKTELTTNEVGVYSSTTLDPGVYDMEVKVTGFKANVTTHLELRTGSVLRHDVALEIGAVTQTVEVHGQAGAAELQRDSGDLSETLGLQTVQEIPSSTRKITELIKLTPGVTMTGLGATQNQTLAFFSIAGNPGGRGANYQLDGTSNNFPRDEGDGGSMSATNPPVESIEELRVVSNSTAAEWGNAIGGVVLMTTKSGTNALHGEGYEFGQNTSLNARNFFAPGRPATHYNNFGGTVGGPIQKNKMFFFYNLEREVNLQSIPSVQTLPTALQRQGDFSQTFALDKNGNPYQIPIYDPKTNVIDPVTGTVTRTQFAGNKIPVHAADGSLNFDPVAVNLLQNYLPMPNTVGNITGASNFIRNREDVYVHRLWNFGRWDYEPTSTDKLFVRLTLDRPLYPELGAYKGLGQNAEAVDADDVGITQSNRTFGAAYTKILSPTTLSDFRFGWVCFNMHFTAQGDDSFTVYKNMAGRLGLQNLDILTTPYFSPSGYYNFGGSGGDFGGRQELIYKNNRTFEFKEKITHQMGKHALRIGGEWADSRNVWSSRVWPSGASYYNTLATAQPGVQNTGNSIASMLLGRVASAIVNDETSPDARTWYLGTYIQDDWRATQHLTINVGVRYDFDKPMIDVLESQNLFDVHKLNPVSGTPGVITFTKNYWNTYHEHEPWYPAQPTVLLPRLGFAYSPKGASTVIRGGFGMFYAGGDYGNTLWDGPQAGNGKQGNWAQDSLGLNPAFFLSQGFPVTVNAPLNDSWGAVKVGQAPIFAPEVWNQNRPVIYTEEWNFGLQHRLGRNLIEFTYMGSVGRHLPCEGCNWNEVNPALLGTPANIANPQATRPFPQFGNVTVLSDEGETSLYHALLFSVRRHFSQGLSFELNYTLSSMKDDRSRFETIYNRDLDYGPSNLQRRNNFVGSWVYESPWGKGKKWLSSGPGAAILGGWLLGGFLPIQSGPPASFGNISNTTNSYNGGTQGVNITGPVRKTANFHDPHLQTWYNTSNISAPAPYTFGNAGEGIIQSPNSWEIDVNLTRKVTITERFAVEFRMDAFNVTNHVNMGGGVAGYGNAPGVNNTYGSPSFGQITSTGPARLLQYGLKLYF